MVHLLGLGKNRPPPPEPNPTDTIIPFHYYDNSKHTNNLCFDLIFRFDDILDDEKLRASLSRLLELDGWRKLGARIRRNDAGALEYHVPQSFDSKTRPGFVFSTARFEDVGVDEHPQTSKLAQPHSLDADGWAVVFRVPPHDDASEFKSFIRSPGFPARLDEWLYTDSPQLGIHVMHFQDATLMTLSFLHSLTDMMGLKDILDAWTKVLRGEEESVKPFHGFEVDVLSGLARRKEQPRVKYRFEEMLLKGWGWIWFAASYFFCVELLWPRREEERIVFLPAEHLNRMRRQVMDELPTKEASTTIDDGEEKVSFVSEADVIFAWWTRIVLRAEKPSPSRMISMRNTCCCRSLLGELDLIPSATDSALVTNAVFGIFTFLKVRQVLERSLAFTAAEVRRALMQQRKAEHLQALDAIRRDCLENKRHPAIFGDANMFMFMISNWAKAKLFDVDFSPAVVRQGLSLEKRNNQLGRPSCVQGNSTRSYATRNTGVVVGKDAGGNYWLMYSLRKGAWLEVERELLAMSGAKQAR